MSTLLEDIRGTGDVFRAGVLVRQMVYRIRVYQGFRAQTRGDPIPGRKHLEGSVDYDMERDPLDIICVDLTLHLQDGRTLDFFIRDKDGKIAARGQLSELV
jgi:hypothetical protein